MPNESSDAERAKKEAKHLDPDNPDDLRVLETDPAHRGSWYQTAGYAAEKFRRRLNNSSYFIEAVTDILKPQ